MEYLYKLKAKRLEMLTQAPTQEEMAVLQQHLEYLQGLAQQEVLILAGRTLNNDESTMGLSIFRADSEEQARHIMNHDPAVRQGIMSAELFPYRVAVMGR